MQTCISCQKQSEGNYCSNCGEELVVKRITTGSILKATVLQVLDVEAPVGKTIKDMLVRPGEMIRSYLAGNRKTYYKPISFYILMLTIYYIVFFAVGMDREEILMHYGNIEQSSGDPVIDEWNAKFSLYMRKYIKFFGIALIPFQVMMTRLFIRKTGYNTGETFVVWLYINAMFSFLGLFTMWFAFIEVSLYYNLSYLMNIVFSTYILKQVYQMNLVKAIYKSVLVNFAAIVIMMFCFGIVGMIFFFSKYSA